MAEGCKEGGCPVGGFSRRAKRADRIKETDGWNSLFLGKAGTLFQVRPGAKSGIQRTRKNKSARGAIRWFIVNRTDVMCEGS